MLVECATTSRSVLARNILESRFALLEDGDFPLVVGKSYTVYAMTVFLGHVWFYVLDEHCTYFPVWNPSHLFNLKDPRFSKYWIMGFASPSNSDDLGPIVAFPEWASDPYFYDRLTDGDPGTVAVFQRYKALIDEECRPAPDAVT